MIIRTLIVEDEPKARDMLREFAAGLPWLDVIGEAGDGRTAVRIIDELRPDLLFLDVQIPELSGLEVLERIEHGPEIIFTTAYEQYAVTAFELGALDYLLKPFGKRRFNQAMERVRRRYFEPHEVVKGLPSRDRALAALGQVSTQPIERFFVRDSRGRILQLSAHDITHLTAADDYVEVHASGSSYLVNLTMNQLERRLDPRCFQRVHRSHIVNLNHVRSIESVKPRLILLMSDGSKVPVSRTGAEAIKKQIL